MTPKYIASALVITARGVNVAAAQNATAWTDAATAYTSHQKEWRGSKLGGVEVYNDANETIGDISEIILDKLGKVANVIIGVGGFLGMGDKLHWVNEPSRSATGASDRPSAAPAPRVDSNARTASDGNARTTTGSIAGTARNTNWHPDQVVHLATKDQL